MQKKNRSSKGNKKSSLKRRSASASPKRRTNRARHEARKVDKTLKRTKVSAAAIRKTASVTKKVAPEAEAAHEREADRIKEVDAIISGGVFSEFVVKNVGKQGAEMMKALNGAPHTDDRLAARMNTKVNEVRRMLNVLNGYGITKYDINKDGKGWLTFRWYLDRDKLSAFNTALLEKQNGQKVSLQENCNDFFYCTSCYDNQKLILPFDSAYELNFKCEGCGKIFGVLNKEQANAMFSSEKTI